MPKGMPTSDDAAARKERTMTSVVVVVLAMCDGRVRSEQVTCDLVDLVSQVAGDNTLIN